MIVIDPPAPVRAVAESGASGQVRKPVLEEVTLGTRIEIIPVRRLKQARINDQIYKPIRTDDPDIIALGGSIKEKGLLEAIVVTLDDVIVSGHRRRGGCLVAGLREVPVRRISIRSSHPRFPEFVTAFNQQREKSATERIREQIASTSAEDAHNALLAFRKVEDAKAFRRLEDTGLRVLKPASCAKRSEITAVKRPMLDAVSALLDKYRRYWPLTLRQIHYRLLPLSVVRNTDDGTIYTNTQQCYKDLSDLLTRARIANLLPWESMHDPTRPRSDWHQWDSTGRYVREQLDGFLCGYKRNLLQSQPAYVELVVEKLTVQDIAQRAAAPYHVPVGVGRGYTSTSSLAYTADRFRASGKDRFILLIASDLDPEGENICDTWTACLRDEHGIGENISAVKVAINPDHVARYNLSPLPIKERSSRASKFAAKHGSSVYELEALEPEQLQALIHDAITSVLDMPTFVTEQRRESEDARVLMALRHQVQEHLRGCNLQEPEGGAT